MAHLRLALLLLVVAAFCTQIFQATDITGRCVCEKVNTYGAVKGNMSDFHVVEKRPGCDKTELIVTMVGRDNSTAQLCLKVNGKMAIAFLRCWEHRINKNETRKIECLKKRKSERK